MIVFNNFLTEYYLLIKAFHVISMVAWMAALLYLPRLFVYHTKTKKNSESSNMLKIMEYKLQKFIMTPAMFATLFFGILLLNIDGIVNWSDKWMYFKLIMVLGLFFIHYLLIKHRKDFYYDKNKYSEKYYRILNEAPTILLIIIIILVYIKPF